MDGSNRRVYLARIRDFVEGVAFPATKHEVIAQAHRQNTPSDIVGDLDRLKADRFVSLDEVVTAVDQLHFGAVAR